ncbi:alpha/beta hydrolase [Hyphomicrobium nitrativorans NL23]|uniref:Alpha/beta hydrolase n=1 Tax=Hyphomicrobium nitrativorans NL23 TaxID=1029756 RepID=V5SCK8_9HYPH|nr:alpha/beta hydrolase [Hyphomicrobium nitrativorans]AHB47704.1 alpha/beta hydrolase [Hyphomicrobium nitrativorans NL23]
MNLKLLPGAPVSPAWRWGRAAALAATGLAASALLVNHLARRAEKAHRPIGQFASVGKMRVHYVDRGSGPPVLVLHGNGGVLEELTSSGLIDHLARTHRVIALDRPGFGLSPRPDRGWSPEREARLLLALMHQLGLDRPVIVAHSWATLVALNLALEEPDAVSGLVLVAGYYYPTTRGDVAMQRLVAMPVVGDVLRNTIWPLWARVAAPLAFKRVFSPLAPTKAFLSSYPVAMAVRPSQLRAVADDTVDMPNAAARLTARYGELQIPVDLIAGADDRMVSTADHSRRLHRELHNSFVDEVPGVGHMVHHAHPKLIERRVAHVFQRALKPVSTVEPAT